MAALQFSALVAAVTFGLVSGMASARAQVDPREPDPAAWLRQVYDFYHRTENAPDLSKAANDSLIDERASKAFAALLKRNTDCKVKSQGVCALDWDYVIDCQA